LIVMSFWIVDIQKYKNLDTVKILLIEGLYHSLISSVIREGDDF